MPQSYQIIISSSLFYKYTNNKIKYFHRESQYSGNGKDKRWREKNLLPDSQFQSTRTSKVCHCSAKLDGNFVCLFVWQYHTLFIILPLSHKSCDSLLIFSCFFIYYKYFPFLKIKFIIFLFIHYCHLENKLL